MPHTLDTGRYIITNVRYGSVAVLSDAREDSEVIAYDARDDPSEKWNVALLNNKNYTIQNFGHGSFAGYEPNPQLGENVFGGSREMQWQIRETTIKGQYAIFPGEDEAYVYWGLPEGKSHSSIIFSGVPHDFKNQWTFKKVEDQNVPSSETTSSPPLSPDDGQDQDVPSSETTSATPDDGQDPAFSSIHSGPKPELTIVIPPKPATSLRV